MITKQDIISEARKWAGVPFRHQGRSARGVDCIGLVLVTAYGLKMSDVQVTSYRRNAQGQNFKAMFEEHMDSIPVKDVAISDVLIFRFGAFDCHCAIVTNKNPLRVIHAYQPYGKVMEEYLAPESALTKVVTGAYRFRGVS